MPAIKLSEQDKRAILTRASGGEKLVVLAKAFAVSVQYVRRLVAEDQEKVSAAVDCATRMDIAFAGELGQTTAEMVEHYNLPARVIRKIIEEEGNKSEAQQDADTAGHWRSRGVYLPLPFTPESLRTWGMGIYAELGKRYGAAKFADRKIKFEALTDKEMLWEGKWANALHDALALAELKADESDLIEG